MSHEWESGFVVREQAWHGLAEVFESPPATSREALEAAKLDWDVELFPVYCSKEQSPSPENLEFTADYRATRRNDTGGLLGVVGSRWSPLQNRDAFGWFDPIVADKTCEFEAAGSLHGGRTVFVLAKVGGSDVEIGPDDIVRPYLLLSNSHDGTRAVTVAFTPIRVVCWNTLSMAHEIADADKPGEKAPSLKVRHVGDVKKTLDAVRELLDFQARTFSVSADQYRSMRQRKLDVIGLRRYVQKVFRPEIADRVALLEEAARHANVDLPDQSFVFLPKDAIESPRKKDDERQKLVAEIVSAAEAAAKDPEIEVDPDAFGKTHREALADEYLATATTRPRSQERVEELFETGPGAELAGSTVWGAYNAVTHYLDHERSRTGNDRAVHDAMFSTDVARTRERAHEEALALL